TGSNQPYGRGVMSGHAPLEVEQTNYHSLLYRYNRILHRLRGKCAARRGRLVHRLALRQTLRSVRLRSAPTACLTCERGQGVGVPGSERKCSLFWQLMSRPMTLVELRKNEAD